jgi:P pilus assembly chaperone PapD
MASLRILRMPEKHPSDSETLFSVCMHYKTERIRN